MNNICSKAFQFFCGLFSCLINGFLAADIQVFTYEQDHPVYGELLDAFSNYTIYKLFLCVSHRYKKNTSTLETPTGKGSDR